MKKRLLITSIVMMLVVAVALSTATYAWFTSSANVTASTVNITAATNDAEALGIGWTGGNAGTYIVAADATAALNPMAPAHLVNGATTDAVTFYSATITTEESTEVFNGTVDSTIVPYTFNNGAQTPVSSFYVKNLSQGKAVSNVTVTATIGTGYEVVAGTTTLAAGTTYYTKDSKGFYIALTAGDSAAVTAGTADYVADTTLASAITSGVYVATNKGDGSDLIRIAIFTKANGDAGYTLKGVISKTSGADTVIANKTNATDGVLNIVAGNATADCAKVQTVTSVNLLTSGNLAINNSTLSNAASSVDVIVKVWYDGVALNDITAGRMASISLNFAAVA